MTLTPETYGYLLPTLDEGLTRKLNTVDMKIIQLCTFIAHYASIYTDNSGHLSLPGQFLRERKQLQSCPAGSHNAIHLCAMIDIAQM